MITIKTAIKKEFIIIFMVFLEKKALKYKITEKVAQLYSVSAVSGSTISQQSIESL